MPSMRIVTTGPDGIPGADGLHFGRGLASDDDGNDFEVYNPLPCPVEGSVSIVAGQVHISRWLGDAWCIISVGCKVTRPDKSGPR